MRILEVGIGLGILAAVGALVNIYPADIYLKWLLFSIGIFVFCVCLTLEIWERIKASRLGVFISFLDKKIVEGQNLMNSNLESMCTHWDGHNNPIDDIIKDFETQYKKWREEIYEGCKEALGEKKEMPFNEGRVPQLFFGGWENRKDYRKYLKQDIRALKDLRILTRKEDVQKKLK